MKNKPPKRIVIIGVPGSGKSTLAVALSKQLELPIYHLDTFVFSEKGEKREHQELVKMIQDMVGKERWIIEGCSIKTLDIRLEHADTVIYLQFPRLFCIWHVLKRFFGHDDALPYPGCVKVFNWLLVKYIWNFDKNKNQLIFDLIKRYPDINFHVLKNRRQVDEFLANDK